jgi:acetyl esterase/lipase
VLAGDSAGAQLASQLTAAIVNPAYAARTGIRPALEPEQLAGIVLHCGIYDLDAMTHLTGVLEWGFKSALWAYTGSRDWSATEAADSMSTIRAVTSALPRAFISGGNGDGLTAVQSVPLSERMRAAGVPVTTMFWPADHEPSLPHEYQFKLDFPDARRALEATIAFLDEVTARPGTRPPDPRPPDAKAPEPPEPFEAPEPPEQPTPPEPAPPTP